LKSTCAYTPGDTCPSGIADCNGTCDHQQKSCSSGSCTPSCGGSACGSATLATWSATDKDTSITLSNGDLSATASSYQVAVRATIGKTTGRWYWEVTAESTSSSGYASAGVLMMSAQLTYGLGNSVAPGAGYNVTGTLSTSMTNVMGCAFSTGNVIGVALDLDTNVVYFSLDGVWQGGGDPDGSKGGIVLSTGQSVFPAVSLGSGDVLTANFGQSSFAHSPPSGFSAVSN
jgi:hypothetical protein